MAIRNVRTPRRRTAVFLVGNAGAGKTSVARRLVAEDCRLFQIDSYYLTTARTAEAEWSRDEPYRRRAYASLTRDVLRALRNGHGVIVETTGASAETAALVERLKRRRGLTTVVVHLRVARATAKNRIRARNASRYPVKCPLAFVDVVGAALEAPTLPIDFTVNGNLSRQGVLREVRAILRTLRP